MKVFNFIWGYALGAGIDKCFLTYTRLGEVDSDIKIKNVCIRIENLSNHTKPLEDLGVGFIDIKSRWDFAWIRQLHYIIRCYKPDVVFTHGFNGAIVMLILRIIKRVRVKCVFTYHGIYNPPKSSRKILTPFLNKLYFFSYKKLATKVICVSNDSKCQLLSEKIPEDNVVVVYNGIPDKMLENLSDKSEDTINLLTASRIDSIKGLNYLLDALSILNTKGLNFHYYMVGDGPELPTLKLMTTHLNLQDKVSFIGFQDDVSVWLDKADIFTIPSLQENHSIALLEAMRAGKGIVASNVGGNPESIRDSIDGLLVPAKDSVALAAALEKMITDKDFRKRCATSARNRFEEEFTEEAMMRNIVEVLRRAVC